MYVVKSLLNIFFILSRRGISVFLSVCRHNTTLRGYQEHSIGMKNLSRLSVAKEGVKEGAWVVVLHNDPDLK